MDTFLISNKDWFSRYLFSAIYPSSTFFALAQTNKEIREFCKKYGNVNAMRQNYFIHSVSALRWYESLVRRPAITLMKSIAFLGSVECMEYALNNSGVFPDLEESVDMAAYNGRIDMLQVLMDVGGARPNETTLQLCFLFLHYEAAVFLIKNGCQMTIHNLYSAIERKWIPSLFLLLIEYGCPYDETIFIRAIYHDNIDVIRWGLKHDAIEEKKEYLSYLAETCGCRDIAELLRA